MQGEQGGARSGSGADVAARGRDTATCDTNPENEKCLDFRMYLSKFQLGLDVKRPYEET